MFEDETELFFLQSPTECLSSSSSISMSAGTDHPHNTKTNKKNTINKRRFSDDQIRSMEMMFESETKLEPAKKLQLAKELGLQPRQIAIWFQNRRARWKTKQLHKEYTILHDNYNHLASQFDVLKKEKQSLLFQIQNLSELLQKKSGVHVVKEEHGKEQNDTRNRNGLPLSENGVDGGFLSENNYFGFENEAGEMGTMIDKCLLDQCCSSYQWWDV